MTTPILNAPNLIIDLTSIAASGFQGAVSIAERTRRYTDDLNAGKISLTEYQDLLKDLDVESIVATISAEFQIKMALASIINELVSIAGGLVSKKL